MSNTVTMASDANLYQSDASRIEAFFDTEVFLQNILKPMIDASAVHHQIKEVVVFDNGAAENTDVIGLLFGDESLGFVTLLATNSGRQANEILGIFPIAEGMVQRVHIDEVIVWNNQICATVRCSAKGYPFAFFATDYYFNREKYLDNEYLDINLAAFSCAAEEAERGFSFEGQKAVDWLAKMGQDTTYNEDGTVLPVQFSTERLVAYLAVEPKAPDEAQFQSPAGPVESNSIAGVELFKTDFTIRGEDANFHVPILIRRELIPNLEEDMPIRGYSCMIGKIAE